MSLTRADFPGGAGGPRNKSLGAKTVAVTLSSPILIGVRPMKSPFVPISVAILFADGFEQVEREEPGPARLKTFGGKSQGS